MELIKAIFFYPWSETRDKHYSEGINTLIGSGISAIISGFTLACAVKILGGLL